LLMADIKSAVDSAIEFAKSALGPDRTVGIRLEEIESSNVEGRDVWLITLSSSFKGLGLIAEIRASAALGADSAREYKVFTVAKDSGEVLSMKIRLLVAPAA
jgi:hypothetical protein